MAAASYVAEMLFASITEPHKFDVFNEPEKMQSLRQALENDEDWPSPPAEDNDAAPQN